MAVPEALWIARLKNPHPCTLLPFHVMMFPVLPVLIHPYRKVLSMIPYGSTRQQMHSVTAEDLRQLPVVTIQVRNAFIRLSEQMAGLPETEKQKMQFVMSANLLKLATELNALCGFQHYEADLDTALRNDDVAGFIAALDGILAHSAPGSRSLTRTF